MDLRAGHLLVLDRGVAHDLEALEECDVLLKIAWRDDGGLASSVDPVP